MNTLLFVTLGHTCPGVIPIKLEFIATICTNRQTSRQREIYTFVHLF